MRTDTLLRTARWTPLPVTVVAPFAATAYLRTPDGAEGLGSPWVAAWSDRLYAAVPGAFTWADPQTVYMTYGKVGVLAFVGVLCALVAARRRDTARSRLSRWAPVAGLVAFGLGAAGMVGEYWTPWTDTVYLTVSVPAVLLVLLSSPFLGTWLLRRRLGTRVGGWLVALTPLGLVGLSVVGGHLGFALVWLSVSWALVAHGLLAGPYGRTTRPDGDPYDRLSRPAHEHATGRARRP